jgi:hypothetical protein
MGASSHTLDRVEVTFDGDRMVADAGLILPATLSQHLGVEALVDELVSVGHRPGRKLLTVVHALLAGGDCIDDADILRSGATSEVVGHEVMAPSTIGTWLRSFTFGHVRQLDALTERLLTAAWAAGAGPGAAPLVIDVDSTICQTHGYAKQGATYGYTRQRGYHPLLATRADTGEILHARMRKGSANSSRGAQRFVRETIRRVRRAGATGPIVLRADSAFWSAKVITACRDHNVRFSITVRATKAVVAAIDGIDETAWVDIDYTDGGVAQVAETTLAGRRLIVRRTRLVGAQAQLWPDWRHHAFITDLDGDAVAVDADHRAHAVVELAIRDLKAGAGLTHCPSGRFNANAAWLVLTALAHNLLRWVAAIGLGARGELVAAKTLRRTLLALPGRITRSARRLVLHLPVDWPWAAWFELALARLRCIPYPT